MFKIPLKRELKNNVDVKGRGEEEKGSSEREKITSKLSHTSSQQNTSPYNPYNHYKIPLMLFTFLILTLSFILITSYSLQHVDYHKAWIPLHQIALSYMNPITIDQNNNNKIDTRYLEVSLQNITDVYGLTSTGTLNIGGINSLGPIISSGNLNIGAGKLFVDVSMGNVGIGTSNPQATLDVNGTLNVNGDVNLSGVVYVDETTGRVGIGTSNPTTSLEVKGELGSVLVMPYKTVDPDPLISIHNFDTEKNYLSIGVGSWASVFITDAPAGFQFRIGGNYSEEDIVGRPNELSINHGNISVAILPNGNVGIGTTNPQAKLTIYDVNENKWGLIINRTSSGYDVGLNGLLISSEGGDNNDILLKIEGDTDGMLKNIMTVLGSGNVGIGTTSPSQKLDVRGNITYLYLIPSCNAADYGANAAAFWQDNKHCYLRFDPTGGVTWYEARRACERIKAHLVTITSPDEMSFINSTLLNSAPPNYNYWIGYTDARQEGNWEWITGEVAVTGQDLIYEYWDTGEPNDTNGDEDCAHIWYTNTGRGHTWNDLNCGRRDRSSAGGSYINGYICEKEI